MDKNEAKARIEELRALLWENSRRYYVENMPTMSDFDYDHLMRELEDLENEWPEFYSPDYSKQKLPQKGAGGSDYRRTLYWNPDVQLDENGEAVVTFYNNSRQTSLSAEAEGQAPDGTLLWGQKGME